MKTLKNSNMENSNDAGEIKTLQIQIEKLQAFKDYVHQRLDEAGIEKEPNGEHSKHGCRIGDRLDIVLSSPSTEGAEKEEIIKEYDKFAKSFEYSGNVTPSFEFWFKAYYKPKPQQPEPQRGKEAKEEAKWISVEDRLPAKDVMVIACNKNTWDFAELKNDKLKFQHWNDKVTHWMPLPVLPKS